MNFNPKIKSLCEKHNENIDNAFMALLFLYFDFKDEYLKSYFESTLSKLSALKIFNIKYNDDEVKVEWLLPLFDGEEVNNDVYWEWIKTEYIPLFKTIRSDCGGTVAASTIKMKKFFASHPDVRKEEVIEATKAYINTVRDPKYLQRAGYFIYKDKDSRLEEFISIIRERNITVSDNKRLKLQT